MLSSKSSTQSFRRLGLGLQGRHSKISLPMLVLQALPNNLDEAGSETVAFLKSLDVLAKKGEKILHDVRFACLQNWFARSAWHEKLHFIVCLLHFCEGTALIRELLICICHAGTKDAIFLSYMQSDGSSDDHILMDDNRSLDPDTLSNVRILDLIWFMGLEEDEKLNVLIGLLLIGGGILSYRVYREALRILDERKEVNIVLNKGQIIKCAEKEYVIPEIEEIKKKKKGKMSRKSREESVAVSRPKVAEDAKSEELEDKADVSPEEAELKKEIKIQNAIWEAKLDAIRKSMVDQESGKKNEKTGNKGKGADTAKETENLDMLQLLPPSIVKMVINMLDPQSLTEAKKVNSYWASVIESTLKDNAARQKLDNVIAKISNIKYPSHLQVPEIPEKSSKLSQSFVEGKFYRSFSEQPLNLLPTIAESRSQHLSRTILPSSSMFSTSMMNKDNIFRSVSAIQGKDAIIRSSTPKEDLSNLSSNILHAYNVSSLAQSRKISFQDEKWQEYLRHKSVKRKAEILDLLSISQQSSPREYRRMYLNKHRIVSIINDFVHLRVMTCGSGHRLMAVTDEKHNVIFFSLITGARLTPCLTGHKSTITYMQFHPDDTHIITASMDNTVRCWNIWSGQTLRSYIGHSGKITAIGVSREHMIVASEDKLLRVYHVWSAYCLDSWQSDQVITALKLVGDGKCVYIGQKNGDILMYNYNTHSIEMNISGHILEVSDLHLAEPLLLSSSYDGLVKVWKIDKIAFKELLVLDHGRAVMNVNMVSTQIVSSCHGGCLWVWCLLDGSLIRKFQVWSHTQPIYHIYCADEKDHVKIVVSAEVGVKIFEFIPTLQTKPRRTKPSDQVDSKPVSKNLITPLGSKYSSTKHLKAGLKNSTLCKDLGEPVRVKLKTQRLKALDMRGSVDQALRYPMNIPVTKNCFVSKLCDRENKVFNDETCNLISFPRLATTSKLYKLPLKTQDSVLPTSQKTTIKLKKTKHNLPSHKNVLHFYNVQEIKY